MNTITNTTNNFSERFAKIKVMLNTTETIGKSTLVELNNQGEQIKNVNNFVCVCLNENFHFQKSGLS